MSNGIEAGTGEQSEVERLREELARAQAEVETLRARSAKDDDGVTIHECPPKGEGYFPCCGLPPFERLGDRMTSRPDRVNCDRLRLRERAEGAERAYEVLFARAGARICGLEDALGEAHAALWGMYCAGGNLRRCFEKQLALRNIKIPGAL